MVDIEGIANRIYDIVVSPGTIPGVINGGLSVPLDYGYLIYGILDTEHRYEQETRRIRIMTAIRHDILNHENIVNAVQLIFSLFNKYLSESEQDKIYRSVVTSISGRIATNIIASNIAKSVIERVSFTYAVFKGKGNPVAILSTILLFGGMMERSIKTSENLEAQYPEIYSLLRPHDYDLLYFLFADVLQPFVDAIHVGYTEGRPVFNRIMESVENRMNVSAGR